MKCDKTDIIEIYLVQISVIYHPLFLRSGEGAVPQAFTMTSSLKNTDFYFWEREINKQTLAIPSFCRAKENHSIHSIMVIYVWKCVTHLKNTI